MELHSYLEISHGIESPPLQFTPSTANGDVSSFCFPLDSLITSLNEELNSVEEREETDGNSSPLRSSSPGIFEISGFDEADASEIASQLANADSSPVELPPQLESTEKAEEKPSKRRKKDTPLLTSLITVCPQPLQMIEQENFKVEKISTKKQSNNISKKKRKKPEEETSTVDGYVFNNRGYEICGSLNKFNKPCQRIGRNCPFHGPKEPNSVPRPDLSRSPMKVGPYKKGWSREEHLKFLKALQYYGKGAWKEIATYVGTRTSGQTQVHAQKYFLRQSQDTKKSKRSIHDLALEDLQDLEALPSPGEVEFLESGSPIPSTTFLQDSPPSNLLIPHTQTYHTFVQRAPSTLVLDNGTPAYWTQPQHHSASANPLNQYSQTYSVPSTNTNTEQPPTLNQQLAATLSIKFSSDFYSSNLSEPFAHNSQINQSSRGSSTPSVDPNLQFCFQNQQLEESGDVDDRLQESEPLQHEIKELPELLINAISQHEKFAA